MRQRRLTRRLTDSVTGPAFEQQLRDDAAACESVLEGLLTTAAGPATRLSAAMRYAVLNGLVMGAARLTQGGAQGGAEDAALDRRMLRVAAAVECLHAYSLVHDDLPAMDDAATRRGQPSTHLAFDEATAILAGDALQTMAFEILADPLTHPDPAVRVALVMELAQAGGAAGMAGGQMLDIEAEATSFDLEQTKTMQMMKTGALMSCAVVSGGLVGGADSQLLTALRAYARQLGLAFQIADDLLDYRGDAAVLGKPAGQDALRGKAGFVTLMGYEQAAAAAQAMIDTANAALMPWQNTAGYLQNLATFAITRKR
ncbi:MAG: polyprenyl synthetase family protein [Alphaproteobacteria bacterium]|nr:polyprenyl synthetase family protein [Alphaproteobacteria bacterium]